MSPKIENTYRRDYRDAEKYVRGFLKTDLGDSNVLERFREVYSVRKISDLIFLHYFLLYEIAIHV